MDWYKRYMGDYAQDTASLKMIEHGAYTLLLDFYYSTGSPLPADVQEVYRITRAFERWEQNAVDRVLAKFFTLTESGYKQKRTEAELAKYEKAAEASRANGKLNVKNQTGTGQVPDRVQIPDTRYQNKEKPKSLGAKTAPRRAIAFPDDFVLTEEREQYAFLHRIADVCAEFARFRDHHLAKGTVFKDWDAAWRTWVSRAKQYGSQERPSVAQKDAIYRAEVNVGRGPEVRPTVKVSAPVQADLMRAVSTVAEKKGF